MIRPTTPAELLCQPLMMLPSAVYGMIDDAVRSLFRQQQSGVAAHANVTLPVPAVSVALYDETGQRMRGDIETDPETGQQREREVETEGREPNSLVAVVPLSGVMTRHGYSGFFYSIPGTVDVMRAIARLDRDPAVHSIVLQINSPGGSVTGTPEFSQALYDLRQAGNTEILAVVDDLMASAATYVGTAAKRVFSIPSAYSGSIGTVISYTNYAKALEEAGIDVQFLRTPEKKARFTGAEPMDDDMRETLQNRIEASQNWFIRDVARNRGVSESFAAKSFGQGEVMRADEALDGRLIDDIASVDDVVLMQGDKIRSSQRAGRRRRAQQRLDAAIAQQRELDPEFDDDEEPGQQAGQPASQTE